MKKKFAQFLAIAVHATIGAALAGAPALAQAPAKPPAPAAAVPDAPGAGPEHLYPTEKEEADLHAAWYRLVQMENQLREDQAALSKAAHALPEWRKQEADGEKLKGGIDELTALGNQVLADHAKGDPEIAKKFKFNPQTAQFDLAKPDAAKLPGVPADAPRAK